jgi:hypothetical protein
MLERHPRHPGVPLLRKLLDDEIGPSFTRSEAGPQTRNASAGNPAVNAGLAAGISLWSEPHFPASP